RSPEPDATPNEAKPFLQRGDSRDLEVRVGPRYAAQSEDGYEGCGEGRRIDCKGDPGPERDQCATENGPEQWQRDRPDELVERVCSRQVRTRDELGNDRLERRCEESGPDPVGGDQCDELPEAQCDHQDEERQ